MTPMQVILLGNSPQASELRLSPCSGVRGSKDTCGVLGRHWPLVLPPRDLEGCVIRLCHLHKRSMSWQGLSFLAAGVCAGPVRGKRQKCANDDGLVGGSSRSLSHLPNRPSPWPLQPAGWLLEAGREGETLGAWRVGSGGSWPCHSKGDVPPASCSPGALCLGAAEGAGAADPRSQPLAPGATFPGPQEEAVEAPALGCGL